MQPGDVLEGRFKLERPAGAGGMGEVFQAKDLASGEAVAIKVLLDGCPSDSARFAREAKVLSALSHPGIVRYVAHGVAPSGAPFLAMEWLEGEDLSARLRRGALSVDEAIALGMRTAAALARAHGRGVVHRDLKPSNLFLVGGDVRQVKLLDFGIAWRSDTTRMTQSGAVLGTPGYMAPEQVRNGQDLDARADVFALGCVLFECLTGAPLFTGEHVMALLAKILFQEAPRVSEQQAEVPPALSALVARMLAKDREERPRDGAAVAEALAALGPAGTQTEEVASARGVEPLALTASERWVLSVVLVGLESSPLISAEPTLNEADVAASAAALREIAAAHRGRLELLADGSVIVSIRGAAQVATDQAAQAARAALALRGLTGDRPMALATGRAEVTGKLPVGDAIDRAAQMLAKLAVAPEGARAPGSARPIVIDEVTAGLLDARFDVVEGEGGLELWREREIAEGARTLLGKLTACVGRDWELMTLEKLLAESVEEPMGRAVLVTAPAGMGKSRLAHELMDRVRRHGEGTAIWLGRGDSLRAGSTFGLLGQALRSALGIQEGEPLETQRDKLRARVAEHVPAEDQRRVTEFLGELVGTPFSDEESVPLRAARQDGQLMGDQLRKAWVDFLRAETAAHPVLLVLEDLHWGDLPTVRFIDTALRDASGQPWMVLALARPEVHELFPRLWASRRLQEIRLKELTRKASERLVRQVLGDSIRAETVERLVLQAEGHAFYLEELIRAVAEGKGATLPETVLAMVEARLAGLAGEARRVLRAASVFGEVFWPGGVIALLGSSLQPERTEDLLKALLEQEVLVRRPESRFPGEAELTFRHALLREGAYAMLTEEDRVLGHRLAGEWLSQRGEDDAMVLAEHFERGRELLRAASSYLHAAMQAYRSGNFGAVIDRAHRGLACGAGEEPRLRLLGLLCEVHAWRNELSAVAPYTEEVMRLAAPGSKSWVRAVQARLTLTTSLGMRDEFMAVVDVLQHTEPLPDAVVHGAFAVATSVFYLDVQGQFERASAVLSRLHALVGPIASREPLARAWMNMNHACREAWAHEDPFAGLRASEAAQASFKEANHPMGIRFSQMLFGMNLWFLGAHAQAERELRSAIADRTSFGTLSGAFFLVHVLLDRGADGDALLMANQLIEAGQERRDPMDEGRGHLNRAEILRRLGELEAAEREVRAALQLLIFLPLERLAATTTLAAIQLAQGRAAEAVAVAEEAMARYEARRSFGYKGAFARLVHAEALHAAGEEARARAAIGVARERLLTNAAKIGEPVYRKSFLEEVPENARTLALAEAWLTQVQGAS